MEQSRFLAYHLYRWKTYAMHVVSQATQAPSLHTSPRSQQTMGYQLSRYKNQIKDNCRVPSSTTFPCGSTKFRWRNSNNHHDAIRCHHYKLFKLMQTMVGVFMAPTAGVSFSQSHASIIILILLDSQLSIDYFTNPSLVNYFHDSK